MAAVEARHSARHRWILDRVIKIVSQLVPHTILIILSFAAVMPFIWMFFASFKPFKELVNSLDLLPHVWTLANYERILHRVNFMVAFKNNVVLSLSVTIATLITSSACGYVFAKYQFPGKEVFFTFGAGDDDGAFCGDHGAALHHRCRHGPDRQPCVHYYPQPLVYLRHLHVAPVHGNDPPGSARCRLH